MKQVWKLKEFNWGHFALDGGAMFGVVPKTLWSKLITPDPENRIPMALRSLYLEQDDKKVLVDLGMGHHWDEKLRKIYKLESSPLDEVLQKELSVKREEITHIILTHLHFDHCGFLSSWNEEEKKWISSFPNAKIFLIEENLRNAQNPNPREAASYIQHFWKNPLDKGQFSLIKCEWLELREILPGIHYRRVDGHTRGQGIVYIDSDQGPALFVADLCPTENHIKDVYVMGYDLNPALSVKEKQIVLSEAREQKRRLYFEHSANVASVDL